MLIRSGPRAASGDAIPFLKADGLQLFSRIITNEVPRVSANHQVHGTIIRRSGTPAEVRTTGTVGRGGKKQKRCY